MTGAIPQPVWVPVSSALVEPTWLLLSHDLGVVNEDAAATINAKLGSYDALLIGCGLGQESATRRFMERFLGRNHRQRPSALPAGFAASGGQTGPDEETGPGGEANAAFGTIRRRDQLPSELPPLPPTVIDADGLNNLALMDNWPSFLPEACVLTPHPAEMARLCGFSSVQEVVEDRWALVQARARPPGRRSYSSRAPTHSSPARRGTWPSCPSQRLPLPPPVQATFWPASSPASSHKVCPLSMPPVWAPGCTVAPVNSASERSVAPVSLPGTCCPICPRP